MGQAKRRGTFEQRRADTINRRRVEQEEADRRADLAYAERMRSGRIRPSHHSSLAVAMMMAATAWPMERSLFRNR